MGNSIKAICFLIILVSPKRISYVSGAMGNAFELKIILAGSYWFFIGAYQTHIDMKIISKEGENEELFNEKD